MHVCGQKSLHHDVAHLKTAHMQSDMLHIEARTGFPDNWYHSLMNDMADTAALASFVLSERSDIRSLLMLADAEPGSLHDSRSMGAQISLLRGCKLGLSSIRTTILRF